MRRTASTLVIGAIVLSSAACAAGFRQQRPERGTITVGVTTSGGDAGSLTFRLTVEPAGVAEPVKADAGVVTRSDIPLGTHVVRLLDIPARCTIDGGPERTVTISAQRRTAVVRFAVQCAARVSDRPTSPLIPLRVTASFSVVLSAHGL